MFVYISYFLYLLDFCVRFIYLHSPYFVLFSESTHVSVNTKIGLRVLQSLIYGHFPPLVIDPFYFFHEFYSVFL